MMAARSESSTSPGSRTSSPQLQRQEGAHEEATPRYDQLHFPIIDTIPQLCNGLLNHQFSSLSAWADRNSSAVNKLDISITAAKNHGQSFPPAPPQTHYNQHPPFSKGLLGKASSKSASATNSPALKGLSNSPALKVLAGGAQTALAPQSMASSHPPPQSPSAMLIPGIRGLKVANFSLSDSSTLSQPLQQHLQQHQQQHQHQQQQQQRQFLASPMQSGVGITGQNISQYSTLSLSHMPTQQLRHISLPVSSPIAVGSGGSSPQAVSSLVGAAAMPSQERGPQQQAHIAMIQQQQQLQLAKQKALLLQAQAQKASPPK
jgi:hypothetical protein